MRIGIMTFSDSNDNYGQMLQCWALQTTLKNMGHDAFVIRYEMHADNNWKSIIHRLLLIYPIFSSLRYRFKNYVQRQQHNKLKDSNKKRGFDKFREDYLITTPVIYKSLKEIQSNPPKADCYIAGSDSIWAQLLNNENNRAWFLDFGNPSTRRMSYAASFLMNEYPSKFKPQLKELLNRLNNVSVREMGGVNICEDIGISATRTCDPSLLLTGQDYVDRFRICPANQNYIYLYIVNIKRKDEILWDELSEFVNSRRYDVKITMGSGIFPGYEIFGEDRDYDYCTIEEWLANICNAKAVVVTSFHGVVFSILMEKPFVYVPFKGSRARLNYRIFELLDQVGLSDRILSNENSYEIIFQKETNWDDVKLRLNEFRNRSMYFLNKALA